MKVTLFGATGAVGGECLQQLVAAGHEVTVLVRTPSKLPTEQVANVRVIQGNALERSSVAQAIEGCDAVLFAIGVDKQSPEDLCTDVTRHIVELLRERGSGRLVWCGGGSTLVEEDVLSFGARFVHYYAKFFMGLRHRDKDHQYALLKEYGDVDWVGVRPLQIRKGPAEHRYQTGFIPFSGTSWISFADVAHAMIAQLSDDTWLHKAPIIRN